MRHGFILGIDQGSTTTKAVVINEIGEVICESSHRLSSICLNDGWLEHDPDSIWDSVEKCLTDISTGFDMSLLSAVGITNQRETTLFWDRTTGKALSPAISWQDRRCGGVIEKWKEFSDEITKSTGLPFAAYFSASKIAWILDNCSEVQKSVSKGNACFGTVNTWIIYKLTRGKSHYTDSGNAGRSMFFDIRNNSYCDHLIKKMGIPQSILPKVLPCDGEFGMAIFPETVFKKPVPIRASIGDQMSALFGQCCFDRGEAKCTIGTAMAIAAVTGKYEDPIGICDAVPVIAANLGGSLSFELEAGSFTAGSINDWLINNLHIVKSYDEINELALGVTSTEGVYFVPYFQGTGAPYWDDTARALIIGLSKFHDVRHICRAAIESIAYQVYEVKKEIEKVGMSIDTLHVDGGGAKSDFLLQCIADIADCKIEKPVNTNCTVLGAVFTAGLACGIWETKEELKKIWVLDKSFTPKIDDNQRKKMLIGWAEASKRSLNWANFN